MHTGADQAGGDGQMETFAIYHESLDIVYQEFYENELCTGTYVDKTALEKLSIFFRFVLKTSVAQGVEAVRVLYPYLMTNDQFSKELVDPERPYFQLMNRLVKEGQRHPLSIKLMHTVVYPRRDTRKQIPPCPGSFIGPS